MSYLVLARKWRPQTFGDLVGQEHVARTLRNAITQGRIAHAFLFTGARGVGKTTIARIMARSLNCLDRADASPDPCLKCAACVEIALGRDPDVQEIDGASNNGVDDVRRLQETLPYRPQRDRYKVVIIDEVHMLSTGAWNALLKTLEEPPPHVKFIFATTEVHKVLQTILSRVQRYDFRLIPTVKIRERIAHILRAEGFTFDEAAVALVAREAAGSMRDALSLLDQVIAGVEGELTGVAASKLLGVADRKVLYDLVRAMIVGDAAAALRTLDAIAREGYDLPNASRGILSVIRDLVVARAVSDPAELLDVPDEERAEVKALAAQTEPVDLERLFVAWAKTTEDVSRAREPRWVMEMAAVRLSHRPTLLPVDELMSRLVDLERRLTTGSSAPASGTPGGGGSGPRLGAPAASAVAPPRPPTTSAPAAPQRFGPPRVAPPQGPETPTARATPEVPSMNGSRSSAAPAVIVAPQPEVSPAPQPAVSAAPQPMSWLEQKRARNPDPRPAPVASSPAPAVVQPVAPTVDTSGAPALLDVWRSVVEAVDGSLVPVLKGAVPLEVNATSVRLAVDERDSFFRKKLATPEAREVVAEAASRVFGARPTVELVLGILPDGSLSIARSEENARNAERARREDVLRANPLVQAVCDVLGGEVSRVRLEGDPQ